MPSSEHVLIQCSMGTQSQMCKVYGKGTPERLSASPSALIERKDVLKVAQAYKQLFEQDSVAIQTACTDDIRLSDQGCAMHPVIIGT